MPHYGQEVVIKFMAKVDPGMVFDSSEKRKEDLRLTVGAGQLIEGLDLGIMTMKLGEHADLFIAPKYGYGHIGMPPSVPGNVNLQFRVEIMQIGERRPTKWSMSEEELVTISLRLKDEGNAMYKEKSYKAAENLYRDGVSHMDKVVSVDTPEAKKLKITLHQNLALVLNLQNNYKDAITFCTKCLEDIDDKADKALYHRHTAYVKLKMYDEAI